MAQNYKLDIISPAFIASGVAIQAKGYLYRMLPDKGRRTEPEDYGLEGLEQLTLPGDSHTGEQPIDLSEEKWSGSGDYWLGRTVLTDLVVKVPEMGTMLLQDVAINVTAQKEIVRTALVGSDKEATGFKGTVKEYITQGDYQLTISVGIAAVDSDNRLLDQYPEKAMAAVVKALEVNEALEVSSVFLDIFEIRKIVVTNWTVKQMTYANRQTIEISAVSDSDYVIESTEY